MTADIKAADVARDLLERRNAQGLPSKVSDPAVLRRLAALFGASEPPVGETRKAS